jgi:hypothetical protein
MTSEQREGVTNNTRDLGFGVEWPKNRCLVRVRCRQTVVSGDQGKSMRVFIGIVSVMVLLSSGCGGKSTTARTQSSTHSLAGYVFSFEYPEGTTVQTEGHRNDDGKGTLDEDITTTCGEQVLKIVNGKLTLNGEDRGTVKQGDVIKLRSDGKVWVNQEPRGE